MVEVIYAAKLSLYLGNDLVSMTVHQFSRDRVPENVMDIFKSIVLSRQFVAVAAFGADFGFMWLADLTRGELKRKN